MTIIHNNDSFGQGVCKGINAFVFFLVSIYVVESALYWRSAYTWHVVQIRAQSHADTSLVCSNVWMRTRLYMEFLRASMIIRMWNRCEWNDFRQSKVPFTVLSGFLFVAKGSISCLAHRALARYSCWQSITFKLLSENGGAMYHTPSHYIPRYLKCLKFIIWELF